MIRPTPRSDLGRQRGFSVLVAFGLLFALYGGLRAADVPISASGRALIRELDPVLFERYASPPPPEAPADEAEAPRERVTAARSLEQEVVAAMDQLDALFGEPGSAPTSTPTGSRDVPGAGRPGIAADDPAGRFESVFGDGGLSASVPGSPVPGRVGSPSRGAAAGSSAGALSMTRGEAPPSAMGSGADAQPEVRIDAGAAAGRGARQETDVPAVAPRRFEAEELDRSEVATLEDWMAAHPAELPVGVKVHLNHQPAYQTAVDRFRIDGREIELYLMFNPSVQELHIVMVEGDRSVYLIDRGLQSEGRSLREGTVRRWEGEIVAVDSRSGAASGERTREFYDIFLAWWERERRDVR